MTNLIVASFPSEAQAIQASHKLVELESFGDITVYEKVILKKDSKGETTAIQTDTSDGLRTLSGMALGTMVGAIGGPVGLLIGMVSGTIAGAIVESDYFNFSDDFTSKVSNRIQPGTVAIIAEVYEQGPAFVDNAFGSLGATKVFRSNVDYVYDNYVDDQVEQFDEEISAERARIKSANAAEKSKIQQKIAQLKEKRHQRIAELKGRQKGFIEKIKTSVEEGKTSRLKKKIVKHQTRISELEEKLKEMEH
jgi:uncharacterized membrane protein